MHRSGTNGNEESNKGQPAKHHLEGWPLNRSVYIHKQGYTNTAYISELVPD